MTSSSSIPALAMQKSWQLGLVGFPLSHSLSPLLHNAALQSLGLSGEYRLIPIHPTDFPHEFKNLLGSLKAGEIDGLNVTIPYKTTVLPYLDELSESATLTGAVNTIYSRSGRLVGVNTDAQGFLLDLERLGVLADRFPKPKSALILGSGGSARAVCYALLSNGWNIYFAARQPAHASELLEHFVSVNPMFSQQLHSIVHLSQLDQTPDDIALIVNTTPIGMFPGVDQCVWPARLPFPVNSFVYDLVYNPPHTCLMALAHSQGLACANGMGTLVHQAALAFKIWTGLEPGKSMWERLTA